METKIRIFAILASILMLTVIAMPIVEATRQDTRQDRVGILPIESPIKEEISESVEIDFEIIKNTRELAMVRIGDILITQELDVKYSTKENAKAVLRIEDLNSGEVEEIELRISYKAGEYTTTFYSEDKLLNVVTTRFDPLEPGALREIDKISGDSVASFNSLQSTSVRRFWWDGVRYICGTNIGMPFARPCHNHHSICNIEYGQIQGTRMQHSQLSRADSQSLLTIPPALLGLAIGAIFRVGRLNIWDNCPHIVPIPGWRDS